MKTNEDAPFLEVHVDQVQKLIDEGYEVIDVRDDWEWNKGHIPGAKHIVLNDIIKRPYDHKFRDRTMFVCAVGNRSAIAAEMAVSLGTKDVINFRGGTDAWRQAGLPLETP